MPDNTIKILLFLAQGFEDLEAVAILDVFGWTQYRKDIKKASVITTGFHPVVKSRFGLKVEPDALFSEVNPKDYQAFVLPGGFYSYGFDEAFDESILRLASDIYNNGGYIATMCVGILPIADAGLLKGKKATTYPHSRNHDNIGRLKKNGAKVVKSPVVFDDRIISCSGPGSALDVAFLLMEHLMGSKTSQEVRKFMIYKNEWNSVLSIYHHLTSQSDNGRKLYRVQDFIGYFVNFLTRFCDFILGKEYTNAPKRFTIPNC